jgi:hypothetical protein
MSVGQTYQADNPDMQVAYRWHAPCSLFSCCQSDIKEVQTCRCPCAATENKCLIWRDRC